MNICEAYLLEEVSTFCSYYSEEEMSISSKNVGQSNNDIQTNKLL